jgi:uncharacterized protein involved in response to NO
MADHVANTANIGGRRRAAARSVLFALGFRPFFLLAGLFAPVAILVWVAIFSGWVSPFVPYPPSLWHAHEMLFGFTAAAVCGFFLTAVPNWTGAPPVSGRPLAALAALWLAGRIAVWATAFVTPWAAAAIDLSFLPALLATVLPSLLRGSRKNLVFVAIVAFLVLGNLLFHLEALGIADTAARGLNFTVDLVALLITVVGGRVTPAFTQSALAQRPKDRGRKPPVLVSRLWLNEAAILSVAAMALTDLFAPNSVEVGWLALLAAVLGAVRLSGWRGLRTLHEPLLWVLHLGYGWLVVGLAVKGVSTLTDVLPATVALHGITIGAIGTMTLGVMSRASLGHTGRPLHAGRLLAAAYLLITAAAVVRLAAPLVAPNRYPESVMLSGGLWIAAFAIFAALFVPVLTAPRADQRPG